MNIDLSSTANGGGSHYSNYGNGYQNAGTAPAFLHRELVEVANLLVGSLLTGTDVPEVGSLPDEGTGLPGESGPDTPPTRSSSR